MKEKKTYSQEEKLRHLAQVILAQFPFMRCHGCNGDGKMLDRFRCSTDTECPACKGTGVE